MSAELEGQIGLFEEETNELENNNGETTEFDDELKEAITAKMQQIYNDGMIVGFQTACHTALTKIYSFESSQGKKSANDYKRCLKDLKQFFDIGLSRIAKTSKTEEIEKVETAQN